MKCIPGDELDPNVCVLAVLWRNYAEFVYMCEGPFYMGHIKLWVLGR